jgi:hypothetical protein
MLNCLRDSWRILVLKLFIYIRDVWTTSLSVWDRAQRTTSIFLAILALLPACMYFIYGLDLEWSREAIWAFIIALGGWVALILFVISPFRVWLVQHEELDRLKSPKLKLFFERHNAAFIKPVKLRMPHDDKRTYDGISIRLRVEHAGCTPLKNCQAFIVKSEFSRDGEEYSVIAPYEKIPLKWALEDARDPQKLCAIIPEVPEFVGVIEANETTSYFAAQTLLHSIAQPACFIEAGNYRFRLLITADECPNCPVDMMVYWNGNWKELDAEVRQYPQ